MAPKKEMKKETEQRKSSPKNSDKKVLAEVMDRNKIQEKKIEQERLNQIMGVPGTSLADQVVNAAGTPGAGLTDQQLVGQTLPAARGEIGQTMVPPEQLQAGGQTGQVSPDLLQQALQMLQGVGGGMQNAGQNIQTPENLKAIPPAQQIEGPGVGSKVLAALGFAVPPLIGLTSQPYLQAKAKQQAAIARDKDLVDRALGMFETNPEAAAALLKAPGWRDAFQRQLNLTPKELQELYETSKNLPMSFADTINAIRAGAEVEGSFKGPQGSKIQAPIGERERLGKIHDSLVEEAKRAGRDPNSVTDLDVAFADAQSRSGRGRYDMAATRKGIAMVDTVTGKTIDVTPETLKSSNMEMKPIEDEYGNVLGYTIVDLDDIDRRQEIWFDQAIQQMMDERIAELGLSPQNVTPEELEKIKKESENGFFKSTIKLFGEGLGAALERNIKMGIKGSGRTDQQKIVPGTSATPGTNPLVNKYY